MSKRDRHLKQRLDELFSPPAGPADEQPTALPAESVTEPAGAVRPIEQAGAAAELSLLKAAVEQLPLPAYLKDREHTWVAVNTAFAQLLGRTPDDLVGRTDKEQADEAWQLDDRVLDTGQLEETEETMQLADGTTRTCRMRRTPLGTAARVVQYVMGVVQESHTRLTGAAASGSDSDEPFHVALNAMPSPTIISRTADDVILYANQAFGTFAAVPLAQVIGQPAIRFYADAQDRERVAQGVQQHGELHGYEVRMRRADGSTFWVSLSIRRVKFMGEACVITTLEDISGRKQAEEDLVKFKLGIDRAFYSVMITAVDGTILYVNPAFTEIYGYSAEEAVGRKPNILKSGKVTEEKYVRFWTKLLAGEVVTGEIINKTKDGRLIPIETNNSPLIDEHGHITGFVSMQSDISARKQAEAELRKFQQGLEHSTAAIFITDRQGTITYINPAFEKVYGYTRVEALGQTPRILKSGLIPSKQYQRFWSTLLSGQTVAGEITNRTKDGRLIPIEGSNNPILDETGSIVGFLALHTDISLRKQAEADLLARNKQLATFNRLGQELAQLVTAQEVVEHVYRALGEVLDNRNVYIALYNERKQEISFPIYTLDGERRTVAGRPFGNGMTEYILRTKKALLIPREVQAFAAGIGIASIGRPSQCYIGVPLLSGDKVSGVLAVQDYERENAYSGADLELLSVLASQTATALENVRLYAVEAQRAVQLQTAAEISTAAGTILNVDELLPFVVNLIQQRFNMYYVGLFLLDDARENAILRAGTGAAGQLMLAQQHRLPLDDRSMIGWCIRQRVPRVALDVGEDAEHFDNPDLPDTRSEVALPLISRGQVLGAVTVQSVEAAAFSEQEIAILQTMADQVATTIANAHLFEQARLTRQQAEMRLREAQFLQNVGQTVSSSLDLSNVLDMVMKTIQEEMGFTYNALVLLDKQAQTVSIVRASGTAAGLQGLTRSIEQLQDDILLDILNKGQIELIDGWDDRFDREIYEAQGHAALVRAFVPLRFRSESIGLLEVGYRRADRARITPEEVRLLSGLADQIAVAVENARLFKDSQQRITELAVVNEISRTLTVSQDLQQLFVTIHQQVGRLFDASNFYIATYDGGEDWSLNYQIERGQLLPPARYKLGGGFTSYILQTREHILIRTQQENQAFHRRQNLPTIGESAKSWLGVPLIVGGSIIGVMGIQSYDQEQLYSEPDVTLFSTIGTQAAAAIQNVRLFQEARLRATELSALNDLSWTLASQLDVKQVLHEVWRGVSTLLDTSNFYIALYDPIHEEVSFPVNVSESMLDKEIEVMPSDQGLTGYIIRTRQPLLIAEDTSKRVKELGLESVGGNSQSYLGVPVILGEQVLGVMAIQSYDRARLYDVHDQELMLAIAGQAAIALQNARLFEETQRSARQLVALNDLGQAVSQQIEIEQVLYVTYQQLELLVPIDAFFAILYDRDSNTISFPVVYDEGKLYKEPSALLSPDSNTGQVILNGEPILKLLTLDELAAMTEVEGAVGNVNRPSASLLYVPLKIGVQIIGVLSIQSYQVKAYNNDTVQLLGNVANQVAIAIQNARLFEQAQRTARREQTLREITSRVRSSIDPDAIMRTAVRELGLAMGRQTFIRLGNVEQLSSSPQSRAEASDSGNGHQADLEGDR